MGCSGSRGYERNSVAFLTWKRRFERDGNAAPALLNGRDEKMALQNLSSEHSSPSHSIAAKAVESVESCFSGCWPSPVSDESRSNQSPLFFGRSVDFTQATEQLPPSVLRSSSYSAAELGHDIETAAALWEDLAFDSHLYGVNLAADARLILLGLKGRQDLTKLKLDESKFLAWVEAIALQYVAHSYHNWRHALDVFQFCFMSLFAGGAVDYFSNLDTAALLCAAISHDVKHPGVSNAFLVQTGSQLAITYNDKSPLENMHAATFFEALRQPGLNFLEMLPASDFRKFRAKVVDAILATDMSHHFELVDTLKARLAKDVALSRQKKQASKEDRRLLMQVFLHSADLGHAGRPWNIHRVIVAALEEEFFRQGDRERNLGFTISPMMDRSKDSAAAGQGYFLGQLVNPLLKSFCEFLTPSMSTAIKANLESSCARWDELVAKHNKATAQELLKLARSSRSLSLEDFDGNDSLSSGSDVEREKEGQECSAQDRGNAGRRHTQA